jgi:dolichol-phosphate mannosyltransferase
MGPLVDLIAYFAARSVLPAGQAQLIGFLAAIGVVYVPRLRSMADFRARIPEFKFWIHLTVVGLLAFFVRGGVLSLAVQVWGWREQAAMVGAAVATFAVMGPGYAYCVAHPDWRFKEAAGWRTGAIGIILLAVALRLIYCGQVELLPEETYYWNYSRHLDIGYLDHPPMIAWLIGAGTAVFGQNEFGVRAGALGCDVISAFFIYRVTRNLFGTPSALAAVVLLQALPFFFLAGMISTPDAPLTAAWAATLYFFERALIGERAGAWLGAGLSLGLGMLSKYTIGLLGLSTLVFMLADARARRWLWRFEPYAAAALALAVFSPVIVWNAEHEWASFAFQTSRRLAERPRFALHKLIASMIVLLTPTGFLASALVLPRPMGEPVAGDEEMNARAQRGWRYLQICIAVPLAVFTAFSLRHEVKLDWTGAPWIAAVPALAFGSVRLARHVRTGLRARTRNAWGATFCVLLLIYAAGLYHLAIGIPGLGYGRHAELVPTGWRELGVQITQVADGIERSTGREPLIVGMDRYAIASELAFYSPDRARSVGHTSSAHLFGQVGLMYERWFVPEQQRGRTLLLVAWERADLASERLAASVDELGPVEEGVIMRDHTPMRHYYYRIARGYRGAPPSS